MAADHILNRFHEGNSHEDRFKTIGSILPDSGSGGADAPCRPRHPGGDSRRAGEGTESSRVHRALAERPPGSEARKDEAEKVDWREEAENNIVFPVTYNIHNPSITPYLPAKDKSTGAAVIIAPGGGHMFLTMDREGYDLGKWLADHGVAAFVLKYRLAHDKAGDSKYKVDVDASGGCEARDTPGAQPGRRVGR